MDKKTFLRGIALFSCFFALFVIALGSFTRLADAGLGCPDWPGCYGHLVVPSIEQAPMMVGYKAWAEMIHRYAVGGLSTFIIIIILSIFVFRELRSRRNIVAAVILILLLCYQIMLGRWTVTWKLLPIIVTQHLLGGFFILSTLWFIYFVNRNSVSLTARKSKLLLPALVGLLLILFQLFLGAWTSTNYASLSCSDFPFCSNDNPAFVFYLKDAFDLFSPIGINYEGGILPLHVKQTIQMLHRIGALVVTMYLFSFAIVTALYYKQSRLLRTCFFILGLLTIQLCLGMSNVILKLPVFNAIGHTVFAALLLLAMLTLLIQLFDEKNYVS